MCDGRRLAAGLVCLFCNCVWFQTGCDCGAGEVGDGGSVSSLSLSRGGGWSW